MNPVSDMWFTNIFSQYVACFLFFFRWSFTEIFILTKPNLSFFSSFLPFFFVSCFWCPIEILLSLRSCRFSPKLFFLSLIVLHLAIKSVTQFELFFHICEIQFEVQLCHFSCIMVLKMLFFHYYAFVPLSKINWIQYLCGFCYSIPLIYVSVHHLISHCFYFCSYIIKFEIRNPPILLLFKMNLAILVPFLFHISSRIILFVSIKKSYWDLDKNCIKFQWE